MGRTDDAIQTMRHGLEFLDINDKLGRDYLERYFQFLQLRERDAEVIDQGLKLLRVGKRPPPSDPGSHRPGHGHLAILDRQIP